MSAFRDPEGVHGPPWGSTAPPSVGGSTGLAYRFSLLPRIIPMINHIFKKKLLESRPVFFSFSLLSFRGIRAFLFSSFYFFIFFLFIFCGGGSTLLYTPRRLPLSWVPNITNIIIIIIIIMMIIMFITTFFVHFTLR